MEKEIHANAIHVSRKMNKLKRYWHYTEIIPLELVLMKKKLLLHEGGIQRFIIGELKFVYQMFIK